MSHRSINFLLTATTVLSGIFSLGISAHAASPDVCISVLQNAAQKATSRSGQSKLNLEQYPNYQESAKNCDQVLKDAGFITVSQVRQNRTAAVAVLNGEITQDALNPAIKNQKLNDLRQREARLEQLRREICANPTSETAYACPK